MFLARRQSRGTPGKSRVEVPDSRLKICSSPPSEVPAVLVVGFPTGAFQANCFLVAPGEGEPCVIIDPGQDAEEPVAEALAKYRLSPVAALLTHGHFDHMMAGTPICDGNDIPAWIHPSDSGPGS